MSLEKAPRDGESDATPTEGVGDPADLPTAQEHAEVRDVAESSSPVAWMVRGMVVAAMCVGSANALSYFVRSRGWGGLLGRLDPHDEAIGFPLAIWTENGGYGGHSLEVVPFVIMVGTSLTLGLVLGVWAISHRRRLDGLMSEMASGTQPRWQTNFSIKTLMMMTVLTAVAAAAVVNPRLEILAGIYLLGPALLIAVAFVPRKIKWQQRVAFLVPMTLLTIAVAIAVGSQLRIEFDKVMLAIFICWTPQAALGAIGLTSWILFWELKKQSLPA